MTPSEMWGFIGWGYLLTITLETPVLLAALARRHPVSRRLIAGLWLTACSYPIVVIVLPILMAGQSRMTYLTVAEIFAPLSECLIFFFAFPPDPERDRPLRAWPAGAGVTPIKERDPRAGTYWQDGAAIVAANLLSFLFGEFARAAGWMNW